MTTKTYTVVYEHDDTLWVASVPSLPGCHTQGRTIAQARERIREAISLFDDHADKAVLEDDIRLPKNIASKLRKALAEKKKAEALAARLQAATVAVARALTKDVGVSFADAGELLGVSKQRVQQMLAAAK